MGGAVFQGIRVGLARCAGVNVAETTEALVAGGRGAAARAVVHAGLAHVVSVTEIRVHARLADALSAADKAVVAAVVVDFTATSIIKDLVLVVATFAGSGVTSAVQAVVWARRASSIEERETIVALFAVSAQVADSALSHRAHGAGILVVHVVTVSALLAGVSVLGRVIGCCLKQAGGAAVQIAVDAVAVVVLVVPGGALEAGSVFVTVAVGTVSAASEHAAFASTVGGAVFASVATIRGVFLALGIVTTAATVALVVLQHVNGAEVGVPAVGQGNAFAMVVGLVVAGLALHAVSLLVAVLAVVEVSAGLIVVGGAKVRAQSAIGVAATQLGSVLTLKAGATIVVSGIRVVAAITDVGEAVSGGEALESVNVVRVAVGASAAGLAVAARVAVVDARNAFAVGAGADVVAIVADLALAAALAGDAVVAALVGAVDASAINDVVAGLASVALGGTALQAVGAAGVALASVAVEGEAIQALVALGFRALLAVLSIAGSAGAFCDVVVVAVHAVGADDGVFHFLGVGVENDSTLARRAAFDLARHASAVFLVQVVAVGADEASIVVVSVAAERAAVQQALCARTVGIAVDRVAITVIDFVFHALGVSAAAAALALVVVEQANVADIGVPAGGKGNAVTPWVTLRVVVSDLACAAETLSEAVRAVVEVSAHILVVVGANSIGSTAQATGIAAAILGGLLVAGASAPVVRGGTAVANVGVHFVLRGARSRNVVEDVAILTRVASVSISTRGAVGGACCAARTLAVVEKHHGVPVVASFALVVLFAFDAVVAAVRSDEPAGSINLSFVKISALEAATNVSVGINSGTGVTVLTAGSATSFVIHVVTIGTRVANFVTARNHAFAAASDAARKTLGDLACSCCFGRRPSGHAEARSGHGSCRETVQVVTTDAQLATRSAVFTDGAILNFAGFARAIVSVGGGVTFVA